MKYKGTDRISDAIEHSISYREVVTVEVADIHVAYNNLRHRVQGYCDYVNLTSCCERECKVRQAWSVGRSESWRIQLVQLRPIV